MQTLNLQEVALWIIVAAFLFFIGRVIALWYYKIDERLTQQHETNRLLRKIAGEPEIFSRPIHQARSKVQPVVSTKESADLPVNR